MLPKIPNHWPRDIVEGSLREAGLRDIEIASVGGISWYALGTRPAKSGDE